MTILVTGATRGIGRGLFDAAVAAGEDVIGTCRGPSPDTPGGSDAEAPGGALAYRSSKAAAINLGRNLARDLALEGIAVGIYHPGWVQTDMGGPRASLPVARSVAGAHDLPS